jgi:uncharacterized protein YndB with AHSA1/START domain
MQNTITKEAFIEAPIAHVWNAISNAEEISKWFIKADFKAEPGYHYTFTASEEHNCTQITGEVKEATPYSLIYTWVVQNTTTETTVKWKLEEKNGGTHLHLEHSGISSYPGDSAAAMFTSFDSGWTNCISELKGYVGVAAKSKV